jgi:sec-independent protein translocase protein TatC
MSTEDRVIDEDAARTINSGRETLGAMLGTAQTHLQKVFIFFVIGLLATIYALRIYIWPKLKEDLLARGVGADVVATTPFDVILLQVKIGLIIGIIMIIPALIYYGRQPLKERGFYPEDGLAQPIFVGLGALAAVLFVGGITYAYQLFFPLMFDFLANNATSAGFSPTYSIVDWTEFIFILALSFGLAAELPLAMSGLAYAGIVPYETFRDKWKYAVVGIFGFGALFSPPDPFTQAMWAAPLLTLYAASLGLTKLVVKARRGEPTRRTGSPAAFDLDSVDAAGVMAAPPEAFADLSEEEALAHAQTAMEADDAEKAQAILDRFDEVHEADEDEADEDEEAMEAGADGAVEADADETAEVGETAEADADEAVESDADEEHLETGDVSPSADVASNYDDADASAGDADPGGGGNVVGDTATGMVNAFTDEETDEDDIGGYYHDLAFIFDSLTSKMFRIVGSFVLVMAAVFTFLYSGGFGAIRADFISRIPPEVRPEPGAITWPVTLHPVEALVFEVKISTLIALVAVLPMILYYAWPAMEERGFIAGNRNVMYRWGAMLLVGLVAGSAIGYLFVAPPIISYLVQDGIQANMIISYRVNSFFWLVFLTTAGIGLLANVPLTMVMFHRAGIVTYGSFRNRWRIVAITVFALAGLLTPDSVYTMFIVAIPTMLTYGLGLAILWPTTWRKRGRSGGEAEPA